MPAPGAQVNVEYFFRLIYECFTGSCVIAGGAAGILAFLTHLWLWITVIGYLLTFLGLLFIAYCSFRLFALRAKEEEEYGAIHLAHEAAPKNLRWVHIESLMAGDNQSQWREAIIEADIMLGDILNQHGFQGDTVADQLKQVDKSKYPSVDSAWEAHRVRNQIAHDGSVFDLSFILAQRTIGFYEQAFREFGAI